MIYFISILIILIISVTFILSAPAKVKSPNDYIKLIDYVNLNTGIGNYLYA